MARPTPRTGTTSRSRGGGRPYAGPAQTYPGTMSGYGATRGDSVGEAVPAYAYSAAQHDKAFNSKVKPILSRVSRNEETPTLPKGETS